jgi:hypothetical protein
MCNPALLAVGAGVAAAGGAVANRYEETNRLNKATRAANEKAAQEVGRQRQASAEAYGNLGDTLGTIANPTDRMDQLAQQREKQLGDIVSQVRGGEVRDGAPDIVQRGFDKERGDADSHVSQRNYHIARNGALGDLITQNTGSIAETGAKNSMIAEGARRSYGVNQIEQKSAFNTANRRPTITLGDILQIASVAMSMGGTAMGAAGGAAAGGMANATMASPTNANAINWTGFM